MAAAENVFLTRSFVSQHCSLIPFVTGPELMAHRCTYTVVLHDETNVSPQQKLKDNSERVARLKSENSFLAIFALCQSSNISTLCLVCRAAHSSLIHQQFLAQFVVIFFVFYLCVKHLRSWTIFYFAGASSNGSCLCCATETVNTKIVKQPLALSHWTQLRALLSF